MKRYDVVVVGGANLDYLIRCDRFPEPGETARGGPLSVAPGGKGANQALAAARLGARVAFIGCVGDDRAGERVLMDLEREGVDTRGVFIERGARTGTALITVDKKGEKIITVAQGANELLDERAIENVAHIVRSARVFLTQLEVPISSVERAVEIARGANALVMLDAAPAHDLSKGFLSQIDIVRANAGEAQAITGVKVRDMKTARKAARELLSMGVGAACIANDKGDVVVWGDGDVRVKRKKVKKVDTTGAGDAFAAAFAVAIAEGNSLEYAAEFANAASAQKITTEGAQAGLPTRDQVLALL